ncbi:MAG: nuclear transport factor 2 family protein [Pseudomonadota bacterium]
MLTLEELSDRFEIQDLLSAYCHAIDGRAWGRLDTLFTDDAEIDYSATGGIKGSLPEIKSFLESTLPLFSSSQHFVTNPDIRFDGDSAHVRSLLFNPMTMDRDGTPHTMFIGAWYIDEVVKVSGAWRIRKRAQQLAYFHNQ